MERCGFKYVATCPNVPTKDGERCADHAHRSLAEHDAALRADERAKWVRVLEEWASKARPDHAFVAAFNAAAAAIKRDDETPWVK